MIQSFPILFAADLNEILSVLGALVVFVIWLINQINDAKKKQQAQAVRPQPELPPQPAGQAAAAAEVPPADPLRTQIDEFLRRAAQQKLPQPDAPAPPRKPPGRDEVVVLLDESVAAPPRKSLADRMRSQGEAASASRARPSPPSQPPREQKPRSPQRVAPQRPSSVAEHVAEHVGAATQEFRKEVANLGERVKQADAQFDVQLQKKFDHTLGSLAPRQTSRASDQPAASETATPAAQIVALLSSPGGVQQAVMLNEILNRPTDRW
jgi:hypothetical protein